MQVLEISSETTAMKVRSSETTAETEVVKVGASKTIAETTMRVGASETAVVVVVVVTVWSS